MRREDGIRTSLLMLHPVRTSAYWIVIVQFPGVSRSKVSTLSRECTGWQHHGRLERATVTYLVDQAVSAVAVCPDEDIRIDSLNRRSPLRTVHRYRR